MSIIQHRRDNTKEKVEEIKYYEHGAHFKYIDLFKSLVNLVSKAIGKVVFVRYYPCHKSM